MSTTIKTMPNGPYLIEGPCKLIDPSGKEIDVTGRFALCRCGGSARKPLCDGTHGRIGFKADEPVAK